MLILYCLPDQRDQRFGCDADSLTMRHCCYWWRPEPTLEPVDVSADPTTRNNSTKRIKIPTSQRLHPSMCAAWFDELVFGAEQ